MCIRDRLLPAKQTASSEKEVETRLGMVQPATSLPVTPPSPLLPSPPPLPGRRPAPKPPPRSDEGNREGSAALVKGNDSAQTADAHAEEQKLCVNAQATSTFSGASSVMPSSAESDPSTVSTSEQTEEVQMRSKLPESDENSGTKGNRTTLLASQFITAVEKAVKSDKPPAAQKPGRLVVSTLLADKIGAVLTRNPTLKPVPLMDDLPEVGIDVTSHDSEVSPAARKPSTNTSEDTKGVLYSDIFYC